MQLIESPQLILLTYYGRSGSYFVHALLDGAPDTVSLPCDMFRLWEWLKGFKGTEIELFQEFKRVFLDDYFIKNNRTYLLGSLGYEELVNRFQEVYLARINEYKELYCPLKARFIAVHHALNEAINREFTANARIVYQLHVPQPAIIVEMMQMFAGTKHLQMIREPCATLCSLVKAHSKVIPEKKNYIDLLIQTLFGATPIAVNGGNSIGMKLESLHQFPEVSMKKLIQWLGYQWDDRFLLDTMLDAPWRVNAGFTQGFDFSKTIKNNERHKYFMPQRDIELLTFLMRSRYRAWQYDYNTSINESNYSDCIDKALYIEDFNYHQYEQLQQSLSLERAVASTEINHHRQGDHRFLLHYLARNEVSPEYMLELL